MNYRQEQILKYLELNPGWKSPTEIGKQVWGPGHHSSNASPVCLQLVKLGHLMRSEKGYYRLAIDFILNPSLTKVESK
jgi:hypothetical protein